MKEFEWSRATLFRAIKGAEEQGYNIENERTLGYMLRPNEHQSESTFNHFTPKELESLAVVWQMLENTQNEWVEQYADFRSAILQRLRTLGISLEQWEGRVRYLPQHRRRVSAGVFRKVSHALLHKKVIRFHFTRQNGVVEFREVHPQQLMLYRNGWSLDALDESRIGLRGKHDLGIRQFSLDLLSDIREVKKKWVAIAISDLTQELAGGYGLYAGIPDGEAVVHFKGIAAFYVSRETWHKRQKSRSLENGLLELRIPYVSEHPDELLGDILRWGENAQVIGPKKLKEQWKEKIRKMANYLIN